MPSACASRSVRSVRSAGVREPDHALEGDALQLVERSQGRCIQSGRQFRNLLARERPE